MLEDSMKEDNMVQNAIKSLESPGESLVSVGCRRKLDPEEFLTSDIGSPGAPSSCNELFFPNYASGFHPSIPKHITASDEKYVLRCLELIRNYALRAEAWSRTSKVQVSPGGLSDLAEIKTQGSFECPLVAGTDEIIKSFGDSAVCGLTDGLSAINMLKSPLLRHFGSIDFDASFRSMGLHDANKPAYSNIVNSPHRVSNAVSHKLKKEPTVVDHKYASPPVHRRLVSRSSMNSSCSDQSSSSASATSFQGMLQCTWKNGLPQYVFSVDDKREVYAASLSKCDGKALDYVYTFHLRNRCAKEFDDRELGMESVAVMRVSTSISFCPNNLEVRETQFVLSVSVGDSATELQASNQPQRKNNRRLGRRVANTFNLSQSYKPMMPAKPRSSSTILEGIPWDPSEGLHNTTDPLEAVTARNHLPNCELAAIIVKDITKSSQEVDTGGWGLRFLRKSRSDLSPEPPAASQCTRSNGECSTSMDILIPAGLHGGPKTGPSSLTERWISGGCCDCGGWDIGCPLTILNTRSPQEDNNSGQCKSVDLFIKGSKLDLPMLRMVNIHEDLFYLHFQSDLSSLQSFAIAAAIIHSHRHNSL